MTGPSYRIYGNTPYRIAVLHGGPGAPGEMAPVAKTLSEKSGVIEPFQSEKTIDGQVEELRRILVEKTKEPVTLIGFSWGAWLGGIFTARYPGLVRNLVLVSSGPFEKKYIPYMDKTRNERFSGAEKTEIKRLQKALIANNAETAKEAFQKLGKLMSQCDAYAPISEENNVIEFQPDIFHPIMAEASELRNNGLLLKLFSSIQCPVAAIHGDYDPHPFYGVKGPLSRILKNFQFFLLKRCGHKPWNEIYAKKRFYNIIKRFVKTH